MTGCWICDWDVPSDDEWLKRPCADCGIRVEYHDTEHPHRSLREGDCSGYRDASISQLEIFGTVRKKVGS